MSKLLQGPVVGSDGWFENSNCVAERTLMAVIKVERWWSIYISIKVLNFHVEHRRRINTLTVLNTISSSKIIQLSILSIKTNITQLKITALPI